MKVKAIARSVLILIVIGTLVSAQQASAENVFTPKGFDSIKVRASGPPMPAGGPLMAAGGPAPAPGSGALSLRSFAADTVETFDVEIEEEKGPGVGKQLAVFAVITAIVAYAVIVLMQSDDEPEKTTKLPGKDPNPLPTSASLIAPITR
ncbi:MAG: hypothetical protein NTW97_02675 [Candidatus Krumholzibacteria bacterium]|nr:hypothetical protein [Candidatus Krumholzibacteria bacterium]